MRRILTAFFVLVAAVLFGHTASATMLLTNVGSPGSGAPPPYAGPGDIAAYRAWWGLRAYSLAVAGTRAARICNVADAACADVNTLSNGDFDVATAQGAPLLCGGAGGTCTIHTLYNQTGTTLCNAGAAPCDLIQVSIGFRPTLTFGCTGLGASKPCATFATRVLGGGAASTISSVAQPWGVSFVAKRTSNFTTAQTIFGLSSGGFLTAYYQNLNNTAGLYAGTAALDSANATDNTWINYTAIGDGASSSINIDATTVTPGTNPGTGAQSGIILLGQSSGTINPFQGTFVEGGLAGNTLGAAVYALNSNVHAYWGF